MTANEKALASVIDAVIANAPNESVRKHGNAAQSQLLAAIQPGNGHLYNDAMNLIRINLNHALRDLTA